MNPQITVKPFAGRQVHTLVHNGTKKQSLIKQKLVSGHGSELGNYEAIAGRTKKKVITSKLILNLIDVAKKKGKPEREKAYWNTFYCQNKIYTSENRVYGKYCKNRFCTVCCGIRKADIINRYLPTLKTWEDPYFVTLTSKSVPAKSLRKRMQDTLRGFRIIMNRAKKRNQRGKGIKLIGIKSLECNFNPIRKTYNPHLHLIVPNKEMAEWIKKEWLGLLTMKFANPKAQDLRKVDNLETALIEVIKYSSKIFTDPEMKKEGSKKKNINPVVYVSALDNIIWAMKGLRVFDRFGFNLPEQQRRKSSETTLLTECEEWEYDMNKNNWIDTESENKLTDFNPSSHLLGLLKNGFDLVLE